MQIVIFGQRVDPHISDVISHIRNTCSDIDIYVVDQWSHDLSAIKISNSKSRLYVNGTFLNIGEHSTLWWRIKPHFSKEAMNFVDKQQERYWKSQWEHYQRSIELSFPWGKCINNFYSRISMGVKALQLILARNSGFKIPSTVFGNDLDKILHLGKDIFFKHLAANQIREGKANHTARYTKGELAAKGDLIAPCPGIFQEYKNKAYELRVCTFGENIYAYRIESQYYGATEEDWRRMPMPPELISLDKLSATESQKLKRFMKLSNLSYGIFDFIRTPDGELIFLEVNSDGQWKWLERATGIDMSPAIAEMPGVFKNK